MATKTLGKRKGTRGTHKVHLNPIFQEHDEYKLLGNSSGSVTSSGSSASNSSSASGPKVTSRPCMQPDEDLVPETNGRESPESELYTTEQPRLRNQTTTNDSRTNKLRGLKKELRGKSSGSDTSSESSGSQRSNGLDGSGPEIILRPCMQPDEDLVPETNGRESPESELYTTEQPRLRNQTRTNDSRTNKLLGNSSGSVTSSGSSGSRASNSSSGSGPKVTSRPHCDTRWNYKMLVPIISCLVIAAVTVVIVLFYKNDDYNEPYTEECSHEVAHFGSQSTATCIYQYSTISEVDIITLKTRQGDIHFPNPFKNNSLENATEITSKDWTLKFRKKDEKTVELFFVTNITDCNMMGGYEVLLKTSDNETLRLPFIMDIADDYTPTISKINAYIDDGSVNPTLELYCEGVLYCRKYLFYDVNLNEGEQGLIHNENMYCTLNKSKVGVVKASCSNKWADSELLNRKNTILYCAPSVPSDVNNKNISVQEVHRLDEIKDLCTNHLTAGFGDRLQYFCRKRLPTTDLDTTVIEVQFLKNQVDILNSTIPTDGTSQNTSKGRYRLHGHLEGNLLVLNITFNEVYHCDGGAYIVRITNASDIRFELSLPAFGSNSCKTEINFPWQQEKKSTCQFCSEKDVSLYYVTDGSQTDVLPSEGVEITKQFIHGLVKLDLHVKNMSCNTSFLINVSGEVNRTISLVTEGPFFGNVEKTFSNEIGINHTMLFRHFLGCFAKITFTLVTGQAVVHYTENITYSPHNGMILDHFITYQTRNVFNGSLVYSVVNYNDRNMKVKRSEDHFVVIHISDAFCAQKKEGCNYKHPTFNDRFVSCPSNVSLPVEQHCVEGTIWDDPDSDCLGRCE